ncbi:type VI secretion system tip protein TssI/VgrG [Vibrio harveyi]|uniref:type VI secretion system tip protein TssI/VgrG n=1 Tax=Vibrio harveyi TaxID=669 RepID=UPI002F408FC1
MADKYSSSASLMSAKDSSNQEHIISNATVKQALSEPFEIKVMLVSSGFDMQDQLGQFLTINRYFNESGSNTLNRSYNGIVTLIQHLGMDSNLQNHQYEITLKPWFWLLKHTHSFRVYQNQSTQEIVSDIFDNAGFKGNYKISSMPSTKREYCLQYNESDFDFVSRLLAEEGVHYYFEHTSGSHTMILQDAQTPFDKASTAKFDMKETPTGSLPLIEDWCPTVAFHGASVELSSYDYSQTKLITSGSKTSSNTIANNTKLANTRYPTLGISGDMTDLSSNLAKRRIEYVEQDYQSVIASAKHDLFEIGTYFSLSSHLDKDQLGDFSVISMEVEYTENAESSTRLKVIPKDTPHYPQPRSKQVVQGLQSAVVAGSTAGDVNQDEQGRVRIQFQWDTDASGDKTSCYVRVAQMLAGSGYGAQFVPRAGQEVLVSFIDGDPDRPIITGSVYNSKNAPPYAEANTTKSEADDSIELKVGSSKITLSSSSIAIEATNIDVKASSALNLEGTNVTSKATSANKVSGTTTALEATSSNSISGLSISIKADTTLSAEGSLSAEFKSGLKATFDGGVMGEVKGAIVKVN